VAASGMTCLADRTRHASAYVMASADVQYKGLDSSGSIVAPLVFFCTLCSCVGHDFLNFVGITRQTFAE
jgi:hypothetical protein